MVADRSPVFDTAAVVNAASYQGGAIAPGEIVTFFGTGIGPPTPAGAVIDANGRFSTLRSRDSNPLRRHSRRRSSRSRELSRVPSSHPSVGTFTSIDVQIEVDGTRSQPVTVPVARTAPGLFTTNAQGSGQGAILNQDLSPNSAQNPADRGSVVAIYLTGGGATKPQTDRRSDHRSC